MGLFNKLSGDDRAVSPVIGVVLMVAVVVILAAVIGAFVLGLGGNQQSTPQASFDYNDGTLTMSSGDPINPDYLSYSTDGSDPTDWGGATNDNGNVVAGSSVDVTATNTIRVLYDDGNGNTATLTSINLGAGDNSGV